MSVTANVKKLTDHGVRRIVRRNLRRHSELTTLPAGPLLVFSPHQDDESLGCGGVIALKRRAGDSVHVVFVTDGSACYDGGPAATALPTEELIRIRQDEAIAALATLGVERDMITFLDHVDSQLDRLDSAAWQHAVSAIESIIRTVDPAQILAPHPADVHSDHIATSKLVRAALDSWGRSVDVWQYLVWSLWKVEHLADFRAAGTPGLRRVDITPVRALKKEALMHYRSQFEPELDRPRPVPKLLRNYVDIPYELYVVSGPD